MDDWNEFNFCYPFCSQSTHIQGQICKSFQNEQWYHSQIEGITIQHQAKSSLSQDTVRVIGMSIQTILESANDYIRLMQNLMEHRQNFSNAISLLYMQHVQCSESQTQFMQSLSRRCSMSPSLVHSSSHSLGTALSNQDILYSKLRIATESLKKWKRSYSQFVCPLLSPFPCIHLHRTPPSPLS